MATFETPDYIIGNSASITSSLSSVLTQLDQALQALQPAPNSSTVLFNDTVRCYAGGGYTTEMKPSTITQNESAVGTLTYMPSFNLPAVSNQSIQIPPFNANPHQIILQSSPIPLIDTLVPTGYTLAGEIVNSYVFTGSYMVLGCESGNVYYFDGSNWSLVATFNGSIRCVYWSANQSKLYVGGKFDTSTYPAYVGGLNNVCWTQYPNTFVSIGVDTWNNYSGNGFNGAVNAITSDGNYVYFGGEFDNIFNGGLYCPHFACYDLATTQFIYDLGGYGGGGGFDNYVYSMNILNSVLVVVGQFANVNSNIGSANVNYCIGMLMFNGGNGHLVNQYNYLGNGASTLSYPITTYDAVKTDNSTYFYISSNDIFNGLNYLFQAPYYSIPSNSVIGANAYDTQQTSFNLNSGFQSVGGNSKYFLNGSEIATFPFGVYTYWNYSYSRQEFLDTGSGTIYYFGGSNTNTFTLQSGRTLISTGTTYSGGWKITPSGNGYGCSGVLLWNGNWYIPLSVYGSGIPY